MSWRWLLPTALGLLLALSMLPFQVLVLDDWLQLQALQQGSWDLFRFASGSATENASAMSDGRLPWFANPQLKLAFYRPLSSALHALDQELFGLGTLGRGLHSALWYAALCGVATALYRRVLPANHALLAAIVFAVAGVHCQPVLWFAARNGLIAGTFGGLAMLAHLSGRPGRFVLAPVALMLSLAASEAGLGAAALILAHGLIVERGSRRWLAVLPSTSVVLIWAGLYLGLGYGVAHSGAYLDPVHEPLRYLLAAPPRVSFGLAVLVVGVSPELWYLWPAHHGAMAAAAGLALVPFVVWLVATVIALAPERRGVLLWLALGAVLSLLPVMSGLMGSRSFLIPSLASAPIVATLLLDPWRGEGLRRVRFGLAGALLCGHVAAALGLWIGIPLAAGHQASQTEVALRDLGAMGPGAPVVLLDAPSADVAIAGAAQLAVLEREVPDWVALSVRPEEVRVEREEGGFEVEYRGWSWQDDSFKLLYRDAGGSGPAGRRAIGPVTVQVMEDGESLRLRLTGAQDVRFLRWEEGGYREVEAVRQ